MVNYNYHEEGHHDSYDERESYNRNHSPRREYSERSTSSFDDHNSMVRGDIHQSPRRGGTSNHSSYHDDVNLKKSSSTNRRRVDLGESHDSYQERDFNTSNRLTHDQRLENEVHPPPKRSSIINTMRNMYDRFSMRSSLKYNDGFDADLNHKSSRKNHDTGAFVEGRERGGHRRGRDDRMNDRETFERRKYRSRSSERNCSSRNGRDHSGEYHEDVANNNKRGPYKTDPIQHGDRHERRGRGGNEEHDARRMDIEIPMQIQIQPGRESILSDIGHPRHFKSAPTVMQMEGRKPPGRKWTFRRGSPTNSRRSEKGDPNKGPSQKRWTFRRAPPGPRSDRGLSPKRENPDRSNQDSRDTGNKHLTLLIPCVIFNAILLLLIFVVLFGGDTIVRKFIQKRINGDETSET